jgi:transposase-like protein
MGKYKIDQEVKDQILNRIKNEGVSVYQASKDHGVSPNTIYKWLGVSSNAPTYAEVSKLKKENKALLELVGQMTLMINEAQKKN